ncbi:aminopeptidase [Capsulimonas corticalis]|uniref:Aminopeptidase n=1 Tax=Capsulimonas corticalis TaxID=2219043 RepID=A0A402CP62_9BACT|nr:aminopeptidase [Capsulimonas corticalis]BDI33189.1 aminopeptidase [Capsulimonas corticalis]
MHDPRLTKWANTMTQYSLSLKAGQQLLIRVDEAGVPLAREVYASAIRLGAHPHLQVLLDGLDEVFLTTASDEQLEYVSPIRKFEYETIDAMCAIMAPTNTAGLSGVDPAKQAKAQKANSIIRKSLFQRTATEKADWVLTLFPTPAAAQNAGLSLAAYEEFVMSAMFLDQDDPAEAWREFSRKQQHYVDYLNQVKTLRFVAADTDITMSVEGRLWINSDGHRNFPSGEVFSGPIENSVNGRVRYTFPTAHLGHEVHDIQLTFENGRVVSAEASSGLEFLEEMLETDPGARSLGEVAIGNNYGVRRYTRNTLYDEKIGGTFHLALGNAYPETGGVNSSAVHWDMVCDMRPDAGGGAIYADGVVIHENGEWKI